MGLVAPNDDKPTFGDERRWGGISSRRAQIGQSSGSAPRAQYLPFVDGLRAVAILSVVGCHIGLPGFSGGYVGVDVFFVISGFLIINQIKDALEAGRFSILSFYARRALRILPPFLLMLFAVVLVAPFIIPTPNSALELARSAPFSPLMLTNVFFYFRQGYFDIDAKQKPLLHTWTLSVEEQFYLLIPVLLILIFHWRSRRFGATAAWIGIVVGLVSLAGAITQTETSPDERNAAFYFMHWRMWEFVIGGFLGAPLAAAVRRLPGPAIEGLAVAGLALIVAAVVLLDGKSPYPSWRALIPTTGAALIILSGLTHRGPLVARFLALRWMVVVGLVSYAWYLWHWPILTYLRFSRLQEQWLVGDLLGGGALAFAIACASYFFVERPIRRWKTSSGALRQSGRIVLAGVAAMAGAAALGGLGTLGGYLWINSTVTSTYATEGRGGLDNVCQASNYAKFPSRCLGENMAVLMGDSLANSMFPGFARGFDELGVTLVYMGRGGCGPLLLTPTLRPKEKPPQWFTWIRPGGCPKLYPLFDQLLAHPAREISLVVTPRFSDPNTVALWTELISRFDPARTRVLLLGPMPTFETPAMDCVILSDRHGIESRSLRAAAFPGRRFFQVFRPSVREDRSEQPRQYPLHRSHRCLLRCAVLPAVHWRSAHV